MTEQPILTCEGLTKRYGRTEVLRGLDLSLPRGRIIGLLGPNGAGKTTLIKLICGLLTPDSGSISVAGHPVGPESKAVVSYLPERPFLGKWMTVRDGLDLFQDFYADFDRAKAEDMLARLGVDAGARLTALSKGTLEKVHLVLVMSRNAQLYVLDEPIGGVDPAARDFILSTILTNYNEEGSILISTHLIADVETVLDEVLFLRDGTIALHDTVDHIREERGVSVDELFREVFKC
ncbi:MAG: ABC transporter ATP-binding protein [Clostridiales bacterium]|nr:ABC transporter ATP-binding protein [Clostridiales bacterium]MCD7802512.1 ABC transporter ATP-binding protein [Clostridiales bacterium]